MRLDGDDAHRRGAGICTRCGKKVENLPHHFMTKHLQDWRQYLDDARSKESQFLRMGRWMR